MAPGPTSHEDLFRFLLSYHFAKIRFVHFAPSEHGSRLPTDLCNGFWKLKWTNSTQYRINWISMLKYLLKYVQYPLIVPHLGDKFGPDSLLCFVSSTMSLFSRISKLGHPKKRVNILTIVSTIEC